MVIFTPKKCVLLLRYSGMLELESSLILNTFSEIYFFPVFLAVSILSLRIMLIFNFYVEKKHFKSFMLC